MYGFLNPVVPLTEHAAPLYKLLISWISPYPFLITLISFILILCEALLINYIVEKNEIINTTTYLPALVYIILMSLQPEMFSLHPIIIANLFILLALHKLMQTYRRETAYSEAFDTGFYISLACLFYIPTVVFIFLLWIGLIVIRPFIWREWVISLLGLALPWTYLIFAYFWDEKLDMLQYDALYYTLIAPGKSFSTIKFSISNYMQLAVLVVSAFFTAGRFMRDFSKSTVRSRSNLLLILYFFIFSIISIILAPKYSIAYLSFLSIPFSILFSSYLLFAKKEWIAEILFLLLIISAFVNQFFSI
jgi:hypothetical protein